MLGPPSVKDAPPPVEVLIPEARDRQRQRYRRSAVFVSIVVLVVGLLLALVITTTSGGSGNTHPSPKPIATLAASGTTVLIRPVLCFAPAYDAPTSAGGGSGLPACGAPCQLKASTLDVTRTQNGYSSVGVAPDPTFADYPSSTTDAPNRTVLLGGPGGDPFGAPRAVLGPSELRLSASDVESVVTHHDRAGFWSVSIHLGASGAATWDRVAEENFHQFVAIDLGGKVVNTSLVQPRQSSFTSYDGKFVVSGNLTSTAARSLATAVKG